MHSHPAIINIGQNRLKLQEADLIYRSGGPSPEQLLQNREILTLEINKILTYGIRQNEFTNEGSLPELLYLVINDQLPKIQDLQQLTESQVISQKQRFQSPTTQPESMLLKRVTEGQQQKLELYERIQDKQHEVEKAIEIKKISTQIKPKDDTFAKYVIWKNQQAQKIETLEKNRVVSYAQSDSHYAAQKKLVEERIRINKELMTQQKQRSISVQSEQQLFRQQQKQYYKDHAYKDVQHELPAMYKPEKSPLPQKKQQIDQVSAKQIKKEQLQEIRKSLSSSHKSLNDSIHIVKYHNIIDNGTRKSGYLGLSSTQGMFKK